MHRQRNLEIDLEQISNINIYLHYIHERKVFLLNFNAQSRSH